MNYFDQVSEAAAFLRKRLGSLAPRIAIVLGSGLGAVADAVAEPVIVPYTAIPNLPQSTVEGHSGRVVAGLLGSAPVLFLQGRVHFYEGYTPQQVAFPMRVLGLLGVRAVSLPTPPEASRKATEWASSLPSPTTSTSWASTRSPVPMKRASPSAPMPACALPT